ncbi:MFS transporter [Spirillospora sp. NPDC047279]|uniref:MFS transporter n=1 Tax=Spirillospora sp. NPDC047279 TaxID=3155478 RepID=UPI0033D2386B
MAVESHVAKATSPDPATRTPKRLATLVLAVGACVIGISELAAIGVLGLVSDDLGASVGAAGSIVTAYALGVCLGGPLLAVVTTRRDRRSTLVLALALFAACNGMIAIAPTLATIMVVRLVAGSVHGLFIGLATSHAADMAGERRGSAIALVFGGIAVATVLGAPVGRVLGEAFGWRTTFWVVAATASAALLATLRWVPTIDSEAGPAGSLLRRALRFSVLAFLTLIVLVMGGVFTMYTYVTTLLEDRTGVTGPAVSGILLAFGTACAVGTFVGGRLADRSAAFTMVAASAVVTLALGSLALSGSAPVSTTVSLVVCGLAAFVFVPAFQLRLMSLAGPATDLAATLGASAANAGIAIGAAVGAAAMTRGIDALLVVACCLSAAGFAGTFAGNRTPS